MAPMVDQDTADERGVADDDEPPEEDVPPVG